MEGQSTGAEQPQQRPWWFTIAVVAVVGVVLLVVMGAILAGVAIPVYRSKVMAANEAAALRVIRNVEYQQRLHRSESGTYATFDELVAGGGLDARFSGPSPAVDGYVFTLKVTPAGEGRPPFFSINADPVQSEGFSATGRRHFYFDSEITGIRVSEGRQAAATDRPRE